MELTFRKLVEEDFEEASRMIFRTFYKYIMPTYTTEGIEFFRDTTSPLSFKMNTYDGSVTLYGAFEEKTLVGVIGKRGSNHICLFFVNSDYMGKGIGKRLFGYFLDTTDKNSPVTVNASDYGIPVYEKLGFVKADVRKEENGTVYTPMTYIDNKGKN